MKLDDVERMREIGHDWQNAADDEKEWRRLLESAARQLAAVKLDNKAQLVLLEDVQAQLTRLIPVYFASVELRRAESTGRTSTALMRWRNAVDAAEKST